MRCSGFGGLVVVWLVVWLVVLWLVVVGAHWCLWWYGGGVFATPLLPTSSGGDFVVWTEVRIGDFCMFFGLG